MGTETAEQNGSRTPEADLITDPMPDTEEESSPAPDSEEIRSPMQETDLITDPAPDTEEDSAPMQEADQGNPETPDDTEARLSCVTEIDRESPEEVAAAGSVNMPLTFYHRAEIVASPYTPVIPAEFSAAAESSSSDESVTAENSSTDEAAAAKSCSTEEALAAESCSTEEAAAAERCSTDEAVSQGTVSISAAADSVHDLPAAEAGSDPVRDHFSSRLWCGAPCYRTEPFRTYSGKVRISKIQPSALWLRARMTRLWARRCY